MPAPVTPYEILSATHPAERAAKSHLLAVSRSIEARALAQPERASLYICLQQRAFFTQRTAVVYRRLVARGARIHLFGVDLSAPDVLPGANCHSLTWDDPLAAEWNVLLLCDGVGWALSAREKLDQPAGPDRERRFDWLVTRANGRIAVAADALIGRLADVG
jgi:DICT domain-containing protein